MKNLIIFSVIILIVATLGCTSEHQENSIEAIETVNTQIQKQDSARPITNWADSITTNLDSLLTQKQYSEAVQLIDNVYQQANPAELERFKSLVLSKSDDLISEENYHNAKTLLNEYSITFNDVDGWQKLADAKTYLQDWEGAVTAFLKSSALEYRPDKLESTLQSVIRTASYVRANLERKGDELGILNLYQTIYQQHSDYPRFQLELAQSYLRLNDPDSARPLLETLQYDESLGNLAKQKLTALDAKQKTQKTQDNYYSETIIPLLRSGNSLLIEVSLNGQNLRMLLDTGASITALSSEVISSLNLISTGQVIQLNTANGVINSQLFSVSKLMIGEQIISDILVAQIDMNSNIEVQGLLGTDVLNKLGGVIIDNQRNALIIK